MIIKGNDINKLFIIKWRENGININCLGRMISFKYKKFIGIIDEIAVISFTSPPAHSLNFHKTYVIINVIAVDIIDERMKNRLLKYMVNIKLIKKPSANREKTSLLEIILYFISLNDAIIVYINVIIIGIKKIFIKNSNV